jgi:hypothetical protein
MPFPIEPKYVAQTEERLGVRLPLGYVARMLTNNGGTVEAGGDHWQLFPIFDDSDKTRIKRTCNDVVRETKWATGCARFPPEAVAIGSNGTGDKLVFLRGESDVRLGDAVFWWDHETGELEIVADDFPDLKRVN